MRSLPHLTFGSYWFEILFSIFLLSALSVWVCLCQAVHDCFLKKKKNTVEPYFYFAIFFGQFKDSVLLFPPYPSEGLHAHSPLFSTVFHLFYCLFILLGAHTCYSAYVEVRRQTPFRSPFLLLPLRPQG